MQQDTSFHSTLAVRERYRDDYWRNNDPIAQDCLLWRAQTFRHALRQRNRNGVRFATQFSVGHVRDSLFTLALRKS
jgi:hypothetical protein